VKFLVEVENCVSNLIIFGRCCPTGTDAGKIHDAPECVKGNVCQQAAELYSVCVLSMKLRGKISLQLLPKATMDAWPATNRII